MTAVFLCARPFCRLRLREAFWSDARCVFFPYPSAFFGHKKNMTRHAFCSKALFITNT
jgi:hypothetical protein